MDGWGLNVAQQRAVTAPFGHLRINAGAGTGKTKTLAARALWLQDQVGSGQVLALTFSVAARANLAGRIDEMILARRRGAPIPTLTFHGLAYRAVRLGIQLGESRFRAPFAVLTPEAIWRQHAATFVNGIQSTLEPDARPIAYQKAIDMVRQQGAMRPEQLPDGKAIPISVGVNARINVPSTEVREAWSRYERLLVASNTLDYPGFLSEANRILAQPDSEVLARLRRGLRWILVDEFQDTNRGMFLLLRALAGREAALNVVGDANQTIYGFNGSQVTNLTRFEEWVASTGVPVLPPVDLTENYRSAAPILEVANQILAAAGGAVTKLVPAPGPLGTAVDRFRAAGHPVTLVRAPRLDLAADFIAHEIQRLVAEGVSPGEIAILVRKNAGAAVDEKTAQGQAVRDALKGLGLTTGAQPESKEAVAAKAAVDGALEAICSLRALAGRPLEAILAALEAGDYDRFLEGADRQAVATGLRMAMATGATSAGDVREFLADEAIEAESAAAPSIDPEAVQIRTVHSAKGEEFRVVFLLYLGDKQFPHGTFPDVAEERRLLYVGVTRAQERLYILGQHGTRGEDFFARCQAPGVRQVAWTVTGGPAEPDAEESYTLADDE